ncbi:hypothetical protein [Vibrio lentus]|uniref:Uncharacterized protein n=1 Tax=Vibrio lentus TaxID=136468 RepID=A0A855IKN0_9VIBR|nr:hypothetical protein [Vibrio lentus]PMM54454.1 hypothetical protein BCT50_12295 [Vibrio lentus]
MDFLYYAQLITPVVLLIGVIVLFYIVKINKVSKDYENYKNDDFRQSMEQRIYELQRELSINKERFDSVNHLLSEVKYSNSNYISNYHGANTLSPESFLRNLGVSSNVRVDPKKVFVLTPFHPRFDSQYQVIRNTISNFGFSCVKGDDSKMSSAILSHIVSEIASSRVVVANLSGRNPNVFYELGIAHALGKPVLLVSETLDGIPFDIQSQRILTFTTENELASNLERWFIETVVSNT